MLLKDFALTLKSMGWDIEPTEMTFNAGHSIYTIRPIGTRFDYYLTDFTGSTYFLGHFDSESAELENGFVSVTFLESGPKFYLPKVISNG